MRCCYDREQLIRVSRGLPSYLPTRERWYYYPPDNIVFATGWRSPRPAWPRAATNLPAWYDCRCASWRRCAAWSIVVGRCTVRLCDVTLSS